MLRQPASSSTLPINAFCISSLKTAPARGREEGVLQPALTQLCRLWLGWLRTCLWGHHPESASPAQGHPIPRRRSGCPFTERSCPLGDGGGNCLEGAGLLVSSCIFQARGNGVGKDTAPYGANESWEPFQ